MIRKAIYCNNNKTTFLKENKHFGITAGSPPHFGTCSAIPADLHSSDYFTDPFGYEFETFYKLQTCRARPDYCNSYFRNQFENMETVIQRNIENEKFSAMTDKIQ
jgi:hypothetical protein